MDIKTARWKLEQKKGKKEQIESDIQSIDKRIEESEKKKDKYLESRETLNQFVQLLQRKLQSSISDLSTLALESVFGDYYRFVVKFVRRRNKMECDLAFINKEGHEVEPRHSGGGAMDIASFALRISSWSMSRPGSRNVLLLDECFKHLKGEQANLEALNMISQIAHKENIQIIMVSDERIAREKTKEVADRLFVVENIDGVSQVNIEK